MRVLIIRKTTNLELHGQRVSSSVAHGALQESSLLLLQQAHEEHYASLEKLRTLLTQKNISFDEISRRSAWPRSLGYGAVITVGGDGTMLQASQRILDDVPLIGVRSSSESVGYLCTAGMAQLEMLVDQLQDNRLQYTEVFRLRAKITRPGQSTPMLTEPILNDFLFTNTLPAAMTRYAIKLGSTTEIHKSSGVWIATAAGSTAGIYAAGGKKVPLNVRQFQYRVRELYDPLGGTSFNLFGGFFDPNIDPLIIENRSENALLALDGQHAEFSLNFGDQLQFEEAPAIKLARLAN